MSTVVNDLTSAGIAFPSDQPATVPAPNASEWALLAGLRSFLALVVAATHINDLFPSDAFWTRIIPCGAYTAVVCFFLISGYSIANSINTKPDGYGNRRMRRIAPLYVLTIALATIPFLFISVSVPDGRLFECPEPLAVIGNLLLLQGLFVPALATVPAVWSLSFEIWFYGFSPVLRKLRAEWLAAICVVSVVAYALAFNSLHVRYPKDIAFGGGALIMAWAWVGGFAFYFNRRRPIWKLAALLGPPIVLAVSYGLYGSPTSCLLVVTTGAMLVYSRDITIPVWLGNVLNYGGELSYPLYLTHFPSTLLLFALLHKPSGTLYMATSLLIASVAYHLVDKPLRHERRRAVQSTLA